MKLTRPEAQLLLDAGATDKPVVNALDRVLAHDWSFDPHGSHITLLLRRYHELDQVLYHTWTHFRKNRGAPVITDGPRPALRSQPPPPPSRERPLEWPPREGPLPPLPERPRRR